MMNALNTRRLLVVAGLAKAPRRRKRARPIPFPAGERVRYYAMLKALLKEADAVVRDELPALQRAAGGRFDAIRTDDADSVETVLERIRQRLLSTFASPRLIDMVMRVSRRIAERHLFGFLNQLDDLGIGALGVQPLRGEAWLEGALRAHARANVQLIKSMSDRYFASIESATWRTVTQGHRVEELTAFLTEQLNASTRQARLIARDQVGKLQAQLSRLRQKDAGIDEYEWDTSQDERVRPGHRALHGTRQSWSKPPIVGYRKGRPIHAHPGEDVQCRCQSLPVFSELEEAA